jgi:hypothetical protein
MIRKFLQLSHSSFNHLSRRQPCLTRTFTDSALSSFFFQALSNKTNISSIVADVAPFIGVSMTIKLDAIEQLCDEAVIYSALGLGISQRPVVGQPTLSSFRASLRFSDILQSLNLPHAIGGALAHGVWTLPRSTLDVDMDVFFTPFSDDCPTFLKIIVDNGGEFCDHLNNDKLLTHEEVVAKIKRDFSINFFLFGRRFDVFFPKFEVETDLVWELRNCVELVNVGSDKYPFLNKDGITLIKLLWKRTKYIPDLEQMFAANSKTLDLEFIENKLVSLCQDHDDDDSIKLFHRLKNIYCGSRLNIDQIFTEPINVNQLLHASGFIRIF